MALTKPKLSQNIDTDISVFSDPILVLHQGSSLADVDVGFLMNRSNGLTANAAVIWQESSKSFVHILTTSSGVADANLTVQSYANVSVGNVLLINNAGIYVDGTIGSAGQVLASDGSKTYWAPPGGFTGGAVPNQTTFASNVVISNTTPSTSNVTGALVVTGGAGVSGNLYVSNISVGSGNIQFAQKSGMISGATAYLSLLGNPSGSAGISALELAGYTGIAGGTQSRLDFVSKVSNVFYNTSRISSINGPSSTGAGQLVFSTTPDGGSLTERLRIKDDGPIVTAANIVAVGSATSNTTTGAIVVVGGIGLSGGIIAGGNIVAAAVTNSVSTTTGALVVRGGVGIAGNVYSNALYTATGVYWSGNGEAFTSTTIANTAEITANLASGQNVGLSLTATGVAAGNYGSATSIPTIVVDTKGRITSVTSNTVSTTITLAGGSGSGSVSGGGTLTVNGTTNQITTAVSGSTITIALAQDVITPGNLTVIGNLTVQGNTTTFDTETLTVEDVNITLANGAVNAAAADGAGLTVGGANARLLYKSATDSWVFDRGVFASGNLVANSGTVSSSVTSGALVVAGGAGIAGNVYIGATADQSVFLNSYPGWSANAVRQTARWTTSTTTPIGSILGDMWYDSSTDILYEYISDGTNSIWVDVSSAFANTFVVVTGNTITATGNTQATTTTTGALQVQGGVSIATGNLYIGGSGGRAIVATGNIVPSSNLSIQNNLGSDTLWWNNFYGVSTQARYADLAENYQADSNYSFGTVVSFGGHKEITISNTSHDARVAGVISQNPAHLMNGALKGDNVLPLALQGRVPCLVKGPIVKGDLLVSSDIPGIACKLDENKFKYGCLIGKSLDNIDDDSIKLIEIVVGRD